MVRYENKNKRPKKVVNKDFDKDKEKKNKNVSKSSSNGFYYSFLTIILFVLKIP